MDNFISKIKEKLIELFGYDPFQIQNKKQKFENAKTIVKNYCFSYRDDFEDYVIFWMINHIIYTYTSNINDIYDLRIVILAIGDDYFELYASYIINKDAISILNTIIKKIDDNKIVYLYDKQKDFLAHYLYEDNRYSIERYNITIITKKERYFKFGVLQYFKEGVLANVDYIIEECRKDAGLVTRRDNCRSSLVFFMLSFGYLKVFPKDILKIIGKMIYKTKYNKEWDF